MVIIFFFGNLKDFLIKTLQLQQQFIIASIQNCYLGNKTRVEFNGSCLKQDKITQDHGKIVNIYIVYEKNKNVNISSYPALENCLFGAVNLTKNVNFHRYIYSGYDIWFNRERFFSHPSGGTSSNVIIFRVDMSSSTKLITGKTIF